MEVFAFLFTIPFLLIGLFFILLPIIAIIDILRSEFKGNDALMLALLVVFVPFGAIAYFFLAPSRKIYRRQ